MSLLESQGQPLENETLTLEDNLPPETGDVIITVEETPSSAMVSDKSGSHHHLPLLPGLLHFAWQFCKTGAALAWWLLLSSLRWVRYHPTHAIFTAMMFGIVAVLLMTGAQMHDRLLLSQISDKTLDQIIDASTFSREFSADEAVRGSTQEFLRAGAPSWAQRESIRAVLYEARKAELSIFDQAVLLATVEVESGFNPIAHASSTSACGLFQFVKDTGKTFGLPREQCMDPWLNAKAGVTHYLSVFEKIHQRVDAVPPGPEKLFKTFELTYYLHHDGLNSSNPQNDVKAVVLSGVQFLLRVHGILQAEESSKDREPTFAAAFTENLWKILSPYVRIAREELRPVKSAFAGD